MGEVIKCNSFKAINITYNPEKIFFTSDLHFFHRNIMQFCQRPFNNLVEMNEALINNWNNTVDNDSIVLKLLKMKKE